ncbi:MAG: hypothetical protein KDI44_03750 [Thiothrix sp.]|nr:hypothetical protein [Thiothrix sp.]HPQ95074.1 hypothetical protein [Thiolinea sp.]
MLDNNNNNFGLDDFDNDLVLHEVAEKKAKPHVIRRNIEDYLEKKALEQRLKDVFDDDFLMDD